MAKLYPPTIENCVMFKSYIEIPFKHNMAVNYTNCAYALKVKTISTNKEIINLKNGFIKNNKIYFNIQNYSELVNYGEYYKIQVAYIDNSTIGYYSSFALARCTERISNYAFYRDKYLPTKFYLNIFRGINDKSDSLYTYRAWLCELDEALESDLTDQLVQNNFIQNLNNITFKVIGDTGVKTININDYTNDESYKTSFEFNNISFDYLNNKYKYFLVAKITTVNGVSLKTTPVLVPIGVKEEDLSNTANLIVKNNFEYGYIEITVSNGSGFLSRVDEEKYWPLKKMTNESYYDFCVEQGKKYTYSLGKEKFVLNTIDFNSPNAISYSNNGFAIQTIRSDYEDMSLWDGEKILRLKYNPQVSTYKTTRPEQKVETLGSQYPFIFYNTKVGYKELPIQAFIATEMDNNDFINDNYRLMKIYSKDKRRKETESNDNIKYNEGKSLIDEYLYSTDRVTNLQTNNDIDLTINTIDNNFIDIAQEYKNERDFKNKVMAWLNNGKPKLFRSPQEGVFIVQIMGVSMSPNDQLNRKMHTVSMNAIEIAEYNQENLIKYNLFKAGQRYTEQESKPLYSGAVDYSQVEILNSLE